MSDFLAGKEYSIADIATFPWLARHEWHDIGLKKFKNLSRWYEQISKREAVIKGYDCLKKGEIMSGLEWALVAAVAYWLYTK